MQSSLSLKVRVVIVGTALAMIALVWFFVLTQIEHERRQAVDSGIRENVNRVIALEQYVTRTLEAADLATAYVSDRYGQLLEGPQNPVPLVRAVPLADFAVRSPALREINVINAQGALVGSSVASVPARVNVSTTKTFLGHRASSSTALRVNPPSRSRLLPGWFLLLSRRVNLKDGSFGGTVSVQIPPSELTSFLKNGSLSDTDLVSVIGLDGITRARRTGDVLSFGQDLRGKQVMRMQAKNPNITYLGASALDGKVRYFSHRRLPQYGIFVTSGISQAAILAPVRTRARWYVVGGLLFSIVTILAACLVLVLIKRRVAREAEINAANAQLREAQHLARLGDWSFDPVREEFLWSDSLWAMYERTGNPRPVPLSEFGDIIGQHGIETFRFVLKQIEAEGERQEYELAARLPSGVISHRRIVAVPDLDGSGRLIGVHGTDQDITPRKLLESLQEQVGHLSRIDGLNAIAATLAHELTQPLTAASNYLSGSIMMLSPQRELDKAVLTETLGAARTQILNAGEIIRRVRNLVTSRQARVEAISIDDVATSAIKLVEAANPGSDIVVMKEQGFEEARALADPIQLQQVLANLIRNARDASRPREPNIIIRASPANPRRVEVCVIDDGPGIRSGGDVFSPFTRSTNDGLGIGLAICRTLIEAMDGRIWVAETGPSGTTVCISLPAAE